MYVCTYAIVLSIYLSIPGQTWTTEWEHLLLKKVALVEKHLSGLEDPMPVSYPFHSLFWTRHEKSRKRIWQGQGKGMKEYEKGMKGVWTGHEKGMKRAWGLKRVWKEHARKGYEKDMKKACGMKRIWKAYEKGVGHEESMTRVWKGYGQGMKRAWVLNSVRKGYDKGVKSCLRKKKKKKNIYIYIYIWK